jgi:gas vesicle protein
MMEAIMLAFAAFLYATVVSFTSMAVSIFFGHQHLLVVGHIIVLIVFCGGGLGLIGWLKQKLGSPLVNVACSLASLVLITVLTKEGAVQAAHFSYNKIWQVLKMVMMGTIASAAVSLLVRPISARKELRESMRKATGSLGEMLTGITRSFLSGSEQDVKTKSYVEASNLNKTIFKTMVQNLQEAKYEYYVLGKEEEYKIVARLVKSLEQLTQNIGGLRSAVDTQFSLLTKAENEVNGRGPLNRSGSGVFSNHSSPPLSPTQSAVTERRTSILASIDELPEESLESIEEDGSQSISSLRLPHGVQSSADMFSVFISHLGPPLKSLAYTVREVLDELPIGLGPDEALAINSHFRSSLVEATELFVTARREALALLYRNKIPSQTGSPAVAADFEEVAASCGYFGSALEDFAEDMVVFLGILEELKEITNHHSKRTWGWLKFWRRWSRPGSGNSRSSDFPSETIEQGLSRPIANMPYRRNRAVDSEQSKKQHPIRYRFYRATRVLVRDDIRYALKVGIGAVLYAMWSFIPSTQATYGHWRGEWGLLSYMLVCSMTIGASNTTGLHRFSGTCLGAVYAIIGWILAHENPYVLGVFGWLVSLQCFYIIVGQGKGPMGRFILLTYNLSALYAYSLSVRDDEDDDDEGGISPEIWEIVLHRVVAVMTGCIWGIIVTRVLWPISARRKVKKGISMLWLRMGLVWKRGPLGFLLDDDISVSYMDPHEELEMQRFLTQLDTLRNSAAFEFELKGPFPNDSFKRILEATGRMLNSFHAMNVVILKDVNGSIGEKEILKYTEREWKELSWRISHLFSVLASSIKLAYPLNDVLPNIEHARDRLLAKLFEFRRTAAASAMTTDDDYELIYAYALVTGQLEQDIAIIAQEIEKLYGVLNEDDLKLQ